MKNRFIHHKNGWRGRVSSAYMALLNHRFTLTSVTISFLEVSVMTIDTFAVGVYFVFMIAVSLIFRRLVSSSTSNDSHWLHGIAFLWWCRFSQCGLFTTQEHKKNNRSKPTNIKLNNFKWAGHQPLFYSVKQDIQTHVSYLVF